MLCLWKNATGGSRPLAFLFVRLVDPVSLVELLFYLDRCFRCCLPLVTPMVVSQRAISLTVTNVFV